MQLLLKLLAVRRECLLLYRNKIYCSCGSTFEDSAVAENHCVQHEREESVEETSEVQEENILRSLHSLSKILKQEASKNLHRVQPPPEKSVFVLLDELEINGGSAKDVTCSECSKVLSGYAEMKDHFQKCHKECWRPVMDDFIVTSKEDLLKRGVKGWSTLYFCPQPGCKYHILQRADQGPSKNFPNLKLLKQHYTKVHATRVFDCEKCAQRFASQTILQRHVKVCGLDFSCSACGVKYRSLEILQTHGRRKGHAIGSYGKEESKKAKLNFGNIKIDTNFHHSLSGAHSTSVTFHGTSGLLGIAPRPSPMHLSAAIALSELGAEKKFLSKVDVGNQTDMELLTTAPKGLKRSSTTITTQTPSSSTLNGRKRSAETQTRSRRNRWKKSRIIPDPISLVPTTSNDNGASCFVLTEEQETQTPTLPSLSAAATVSSASVGISGYDGGDFPPAFSGWWSAASSSSTQTSPRSSATDIFKDLLLSSNPENESVIAPSLLLLPPPRSHPPRLGELEHFNSTETQTDEGGGEKEVQQHQPQQRRRHAWQEQVESDEDEFALNRLYMEAETQFDLDDILCSNYTQTGFSSDMLSPTLLPVEQEGNSSAMNSIETQTIHSIFDVRSSSVDSGSGGNLKDFATSHMETQTSDDFKIT